jgi:hypothetical protein
MKRPIRLVLVGFLVALVASLYFFFGPPARQHELSKNQLARGKDQLVYAFDGEVDEKGIPAPWQLKVSSGEAQIAVQAHPEAAEQRVLWVKAEKASFFLARSDCEFDPAEYPVLEWSWKAVTLPRGGDIRKSSLNPFAENKNDQALQLLVTFDNGDVISYMWDSTAPAGTEVKERNLWANIMAVVIDSGAEHTGKWRSYTRNIADDYRRLHGGSARTVKAIAVQTNANHTSSQSEGYFGPIVLGKTQ